MQGAVCIAILCRLNSHPCSAGLHCSVEQEFPLAIVSLNITRWTLCALRQGLFTAEGRRRGSMLDAANAFYVGAFYAFYHRWVLEVAAAGLCCQDWVFAGV